MRKSKFLKLRKLISRINDPRLKRFDELKRVAMLPGVDLTKMVDYHKVLTSFQSPSKARLQFLPAFKAFCDSLQSNISK